MSWHKVQTNKKGETRPKNVRKEMNQDGRNILIHFVFIFWGRTKRGWDSMEFRMSYYERGNIGQRHLVDTLILVDWGRSGRTNDSKCSTFRNREPHNPSQNCNFVKTDYDTYVDVFVFLVKRGRKRYLDVKRGPRKLWKMKYVVKETITY